MAENKTVQTDQKIEDYIAGLSDPKRREDSARLVQLYSDLSGESPVVWRGGIVGFGTYDYCSPNGRTTGTWMRAGFAPRKSALTLYFMLGFDNFADELAQLGPHKLGKSCLYLKRLADVDMDTLKRIIERDIVAMDSKYPRN